MNEERSDLSRVMWSTGVYALAALAQRGLSFFLLPVYTRFIEPQEYGVLELLNAFSAVVFAGLMMGLPSAVQKCYHRDCRTAEERSRILATAVGLNLPVLLSGGALLTVIAGPVSRWLVGTGAHAELVQLVVANGVLMSVTALLLAGLRAQERAIAFSVLSLIQFVMAMSLNIALVVHYGLGIRGVLWGNLLSNAIALPLSVSVAARGACWTPSRRLVSPLLRFGLLLVPAMLSGWVIDLSDRYVLSLFGALDEVAVYGVGYKLGMVLQLVVVWPFQLAWPAVSFSISNRPGHRETYARALTYLTLMLIAMGLALAILTRVAVFGLVGEGYQAAYRVVPLVALGYAFNGVQYCVSPGVHVAGKTRYLPLIAAAAAAFNLALNFLLIPRWGMMGASWATAAAFLLLAAGTGAVAQRFYPVRYEYGRLFKLVVTGLAIFLAAIQVQPAISAFSLAWHLFSGLAAFPLALMTLGFFDQRERTAFRHLWQRFVSRIRHHLAK